MDRIQITAVLDQLPEELRATPRFVHHSFFGKEAKLRRLRSAIKRRYDDASFEMGENDLAVITLEVLTPDALLKAVTAMQDDAAAIGVDYDGFEIGTGAVEDLTTFAPLEEAAPPGSLLRFALGTGQFGYLHYLGGTQKEGVLVDCLALCDDGRADANTLAGAARLYRQPVLGVIDPLGVEVVGHAPVQTRRIGFRVATDFPTPEEVDAEAQKIGFDVPLTPDQWDDVLQKLGHAGVSLRRGTPLYCEALLSADGKITWGDTTDMPKGANPMPFGAHVTLASLRQALTGEPDMVALNDAVM